jgi:hypothetical protein
MVVTLIRIFIGDSEHVRKWNESIFNHKIFKLKIIIQYGKNIKIF